ncbi:ergothioneine biosynthesis protein EgtC [Nocardia sp. NBC_00565]|uniref:ergothioneine biosynthesis protein EgtC n=1 Tax=Nocardia sp. NBC_00565 TaxID=2975993 RepID=UPI002E806FCD|nr:ergothioneine biosynthesis protein EgtC [Nocardia sp. NBC_00565]WUC00931.1 ergothioneine biosynthesis protein EgtC [Nocardia sp. NBC_00565]
MCRHLGYLGPQVRVGDMLTLGSHSLRTQAWAPRDMRGGGTINADGFGVAWWRDADDDSVTVSRYRNPAPIWTDPAVEEVLPQLESWAVLASIRSATVGMPVERNACAPFTDGRWAFSHNGVVPDWRRTLGAVAEEFGSTATELGAGQLFEPMRLLETESATDSATLWVILRGLLSTGAPDGSWAAAPAALSLLVAAILDRAPDARLNFLLGDGQQLWATTGYHSLSALVTDDFAILSSEPFDDDPRWQPIPDRQLVSARPGALSVTPLLAVPSTKGSLL